MAGKQSALATALRSLKRNVAERDPDSISEGASPKRGGSDVPPLPQVVQKLARVRSGAWPPGIVMLLRRCRSPGDLRIWRLKGTRLLLMHFFRDGKRYGIMHKCMCEYVIRVYF